MSPLLFAQVVRPTRPPSQRRTAQSTGQLRPEPSSTRCHFLVISLRLMYTNDDILANTSQLRDFEPPDAIVSELAE